MKIVNIIGGLGNQMFQCALAIALNSRYPEEPILIDLHTFNGYKLHYGFEVERIFPLRLSHATYKEVARVAYPYPCYNAWRIGRRLLPKRKHMAVEGLYNKFEPEFLESSNYQYFDGYWQTEDYFVDVRDVILEKFTFPKMDERNFAIASQLRANNSVGVHVRRGDYIKDPLFKGLCQLDYYQAAIRYLEKTVSPKVYCFFSDDIIWCKEHLTPLIRKDKKIIFSSGNTGPNSFRDMQLMSLCHHNIIANSSFSWWGAWLNQHPDKIVVLPQHWMNRDGFNTPKCKGWIAI
jgi:hypothetical protein